VGKSEGKMDKFYRNVFYFNAVCIIIATVLWMIGGLTENKIVFNIGDGFLIVGIIAMFYSVIRLLMKG